MSVTKRLTASEREGMIQMIVADDILSHTPEFLAARAKLVPGAKRDIAMMRAKIQKLNQKFIETIPDDQKMTYLRSLQMRSYMIGCKGPATPKQNTKDFGMWLSFDTINALVSGIRDHCMMCNLDRTGRKSCTLRKTLDAIPNDTQIRDDGDCPYFTMF